MPHALGRFLIAACLLLLSLGLFAQADPLEMLKKFAEPEAPPALITMNVDDTAVELFLQGSWKSYWGDYIGFSPGNEIIPGLKRTPWSNSVDFLLSLWIQRHWFFMTQLSDGFNFRTFSLGYVNADGPGLNKLVIGNNGIDFPKYDYISIGKSANEVPGITAEWSGALSKHAAVLRIVNRNTVTQYFQGNSALITSKTNTNAFIQGRFFQLPYTNLAAIRVWVEGASGFQLLGAQDFQYIDLQRGSFSLAIAATSRVLASWDLSALSQAVLFPDLSTTNQINSGSVVAFNGVAGSSFQTQVTDRLVANYGYKPSGYSSGLPACDVAGLVVPINGYDALLVYQPGLFSVFQDYSWYVRPQGLAPTGAVLDMGQDPALTVAAISNAIHLGYNGVTGIADRFPLLASAYVDKNLLYLPGYRPNADQYLAWTGLNSQGSGIVLDQDPLPDSIQVTRNGLPETGFSWDAGSRSLKFIVPIQANEAITVTYDLSTRVGGSRTLQFAQGNTWKPDPAWAIDAAIGLDWPIEAAGVGSNGTDVGRIMTSTALRYAPKDSNINASLVLGGELSYPNATGTRFLQDFSGGYLLIGLASGRIFPAASPSNSDLLTSGSGILNGTTPGILPAFGVATRGQLFYKNYNPGTGSLNPWTAAPQTSYAYASGNPTGPYLAGNDAGDPFNGIVAVADFNIPISKNWVAMDINLTADQRAALAKTGSIWFYLRSDNLVASDIDLFLQAGQLAEDRDGNGIIDTGTIGANGLPFHDSSNSATLVSGFDYTNQSGSVLTEDSDGNGVLSTSDLFPLSRYIGRFNSGAPLGWQLVRIPISASDRIQLQNSNALRLVIARPNGDINTKTGRILIGQIHVDLPGIAATVQGGTATVVTGTDISVSRQLSLGSAFPGSIRSGDSPAMGRIDWTAGTGTVVASQVIAANSLYDNRYFRFFVQPVNLAGTISNLQFSLQDDSGSNQVQSPMITLSTGSNGTWLRGEFDLSTNQFSLVDQNGGVIAQGSAIIQGHPHEVTHLVIQIPSPANAGSLYIDSISANQGIPAVKGMAKGSFNWAETNPIVKIGDFNLFGNARTTNTAEYIVAGRIGDFPGLDSPGSASLNYEGTLGATISYIDIALGTRFLAGSTNLSGQASYQITVPSGISSPLILKDSFASNLGTSLPFAQKASALSLVFPAISDFKISADINQAQGLLNQNYKAFLGFGDLKNTAVSTALTIAQTANNYQVPDIWNQYGLFDKLGTAYSWYLPFPGSSITQRSITWNNLFSAESSTTGFGLAGKINTQLDPSNSQGFGTGMDLSSYLRLGDPNQELSLSLAYLRRSQSQTTWNGLGIGDDLTQALTNASSFLPAWAAIPLWEMFSNLDYFQTYSKPFSYAMDRPQFTLNLSRPLDNDWTSLLAPKQFSTGIARLMERKGELLDDRFLFFGSFNWNSLNQFGKIGRKPTFNFFDTDQIDYKITAGVLTRSQNVEQWQIAPSLTIALFGMAVDPKQNQWRNRSASAMGLLDLSPPNQFRLNDTFLYRSGSRGDIANAARLEYSWYVDTPDIKYDFLNKKSKESSFLENLEIIEVTTNYPSDTQQTSSSSIANLYDLYGFMESIGTDNGITIAFQHKSYLILPGLAYISAQLSVAYHQGMVAARGNLGVQLYIEARVVF